MLPTTPVTGAAKERFLNFKPLGRSGRPLSQGFEVGQGNSVALGRGIHVIVSSCVQAGVPEVLFDATQVNLKSNLPGSPAYRAIDDQSLRYQSVKPGEIITARPLRGTLHRGRIKSFQITLQP